MLEYRSLNFEKKILDIANYQGNAVVNYTENNIPYTRIIEHKHFEFGTQPKTVKSKEYSAKWKPAMGQYCPINDVVNEKRFQLYNQRSQLEENIIFGGRLDEYKYYDMHQVIGSSLTKAKVELGKICV